MTVPNRKKYAVYLDEKMVKNIRFYMKEELKKRGNGGLSGIINNYLKTIESKCLKF